MTANALEKTRAPGAVSLPEKPYAGSAAQVLATLASTDAGLSDGEADTRRATFGRNELPHSPPPPLWLVFLRQFKNPLIYVLLASTGVAMAMQEWVDAFFILAVLVLNAVIGTAQEQGAEASAEALRGLVTTRVRVLRGGTEHERDAVELVPGDVALLESGARVPADLRLLSSQGLLCDESLLTGESAAVEKNADAGVDASAGLADRPNTVHAGTFVTRGRARGVVVATGRHTQLGRIADTMAQAESAPPPLLVRMEAFTRNVAVLMTAVCVALGLLLLSRGTPVAQAFMLAVAVAVAAIPEGLPVAMTIALSIGARRMGSRRVIARRLVAVEALGSCTFIASDKTGTLTVNQLTVRRMHLPGGGDATVTGEGITPTGTLQPPAGMEEGVFSPLARRLSTAGVFCNDASLEQRGGAWTGLGDAVDVALLALGRKATLDGARLLTEQPRVGAIPFEPEHAYAASAHRGPDGVVRVHVKGAGEKVLRMCNRMATPAGEVPLDTAAMEAAALRLAAEGYRVLALADGVVPAGATLEHAALRDLVFLGYVALQDPLRPEARDAVAACRRAGIQVAMVTGDHPVTALAIARDLGFARAMEDVVTGSALAEARARGQDAFDALVKHAHVFARVEPTQKLEIVQALIRLGHFVAVTGDGANDAPALRAANIGVAMGGRGTDVARESADLVLTDDNFASIVAGVEEGRISYSNVRKVIFLLISCGIAELLIFLAAVLLGMPMPLLPAQVLWLNVVTNGLQDIGLAFEPGEGNELSRPPRRPTEPIFDRRMVERVVLNSVAVAAASLAGFQWFLQRGMDVPDARNMLLMLLVLIEGFQVLASRSEARSAFAINPLRNPALVAGALGAQAIHLVAMFTPGLSSALRVSPIPLADWGLLCGVGLAVLLVDELYKLVRRVPPTPTA